MVKRLVASVLWFVVAATAANVAVLMAGAPSVLSYVAGGAAAAFVGLDPLRVIWPRTGSRFAAARTAEPGS
jgi:hypothetical protein